MDKESRKIFGEAVKNARIEKGMSQDALAKALGYAGRSAISFIENGQRDVPRDMINKMSEVLGVSPLVFFEIRNSYDAYEEYLPYLADADDFTLYAVRKLLGMPIETLDSKK